MNNKQEQVTLKDIIESQGKIQMKAIFNEKILALAEEQKKLLYELARLNKEVKAFDNKERRKEILDFYRETMKRNLRALNILDIETEYKRIDTKLDGLGQGSDITRAHLAYYFAIFDVIKKYGTSTFFPIIIDEPNQQGQDKENMPKILQFIKNNQPKESQIILGVENTREIDFDGEIITINNEPRQFLQKDEFPSVDLEITPLIDKLMALKQEDDPQLILF